MRPQQPHDFLGENTLQGLPCMECPETWMRQLLEHTGSFWMRLKPSHCPSMAVGQSGNLLGRTLMLTILRHYMCMIGTKRVILMCTHKSECPDIEFKTTRCIWVPGYGSQGQLAITFANFCDCARLEYNKITSSHVYWKPKGAEAGSRGISSSMATGSK